MRADVSGIPKGIAEVDTRVFGSAKRMDGSGTDGCCTMKELAKVGTDEFAF